MKIELNDADRDRILATLMDEWSPLQRDLMSSLLRGEEETSDGPLAVRYGIDSSDLRRQRSLARARLRDAILAQQATS